MQEFCFIPMFYKTFFRTYCLIFFCCFGSLYNLNAQDGYQRHKSIDVLSYDFSLALSDTTDRIHGLAEIVILATHTISSFELELDEKDKDNMGMIVERLKVNNKGMTYTHSKDKIHVDLPNPVQQNDTIRVSIEYAGIPSDGLYIHKNQFGQRTFFGDNWPNRAHYWLPCIDHPSDKAMVRFSVLAPLNYRVISNGVLQEETIWDESLKLTVWEELIPVPLKVAVIGVAPFAVKYEGEVAGVELSSWVYNKNRTAGFYDYEEAKKVIEYFTERIGLFPFKKLANVQSTTKYGGMENASCIFYSQSSVTGLQDQEELLAHEIAHQWFGDYITEEDWMHIWLSEGFATFFEAHYVEYAMGQEAYKKKLNADRQKIILDKKHLKKPIIDTTIKDYNDLLNVNSYEKGGWVLYMLRLKLGEEIFWSGLQNYVQKYKGKNVRTENFQQCMEETSKSDLKMFFDQWVYKAGIPALDIKWQYDEQQSELIIDVIQNQDNLFTFPLELGISYAEKDQIDAVIPIEVANNKLSQFKIKVTKKPIKVVTDPNLKLLAIY